MMAAVFPDPMALTLYGGARSRASMVRWYLNEKGIACHQVALDMAAGEHRQETFLAINPFGKVPALVDDSLSGPDGQPLKLCESGAILQHLAEQHAGEFQGEGGAARRSLSAQWILFANATLGPAMFLAASKPEELQRLLRALEGLLGEGSLLKGTWGDPGWSAADCAVQAYLAYIPLFCRDLDLSPFPGIAASISATQARPAYQAAMAGP
jgi:glutathione S-transferase